jgi:hypothetical protein
MTIPLLLILGLLLIGGAFDLHDKREVAKLKANEFDRFAAWWRDTSLGAHDRELARHYRTLASRDQAEADRIRRKWLL